MGYEWRAGDWALVTGASSGIGAEFCRQLAARRMNVVLVARRQPLLEALAAEVRGAHGIETLVVTADLARRGSAERLKAATDAAGLRIRMLVNNAAFGPWGSFSKTCADSYEDIVQLIAGTPVALCWHYLDDLQASGAGVIINLSSPAALQPVPYKAVYSAAKSCLHNFSLALYGELLEKGVVVQTLLPGPTATELDTKGGAYTSALGAERRCPSEIVRLSLDRLSRGEPFVTTNRGTYKQRAFAGLAPTRMVIREVKKMFMAPAGR